MYIYFDTNGTIKEIVNDLPIRNGNNEANKIYCYIEGDPTIDDIWYLQKLPSGELSNEVSFKNSTITKAIPYDAKRDMKYFKDFVQYKFYVYTLNTFLTSQKGLNIATIRIVIDNEIFALGELTFNVQENVIKVDNGITQSQYDYLLLAYASRTLNEVVGDDLDNLLDEKINAKLGDLADGSPKVFDTASNIEAMHGDEGIAVATDTGYIYVWNDTQQEYQSTGMKYIADVSLFYTKTESDSTFAPKSTAITHSGSQLKDYSGNDIYPVTASDIYTEITSGDLNSYASIGNYKIGGTSLGNITNLPSGISGSIGAVVKNEKSSKADNYIMQTFIQSNSLIAFRFCNYGTWADWVYPTNDLTFSNYYNKFNNAVVLSANADLDTLKDYKVYVANSTNTATLVNKPTISGTSGSIIINERSSYATSNDYLKQTFIFGKGNTFVRYLFNNVWTVWEEVATVEKISGVPNYWNSEIDTSISSVLTNYLSMGTHNDIITFVTDMHWEYLNAKHSPSIINAINKKLGIGLTLNGGDVLASSRSTKLLAMNEIDDALKGIDGNLLSTYGNHDYNPVSGQNLSMNDLYNLILKRCEKFAETNQTYRFYVDNTSQKIRYITIPTFDDSTISGTTKTFLHNACDNLSSDWSIVILTHIYWTPTQTGNPTITTYSASSMQWIADLKESINATLIAVLVGHVHRDYDALVSSTSGDTNLLVIGFQEDAYGSSTMWQGETMTLGTDTEQAISIIQFDMDNKKIYITRCGAGSDRTFTYN